MILFFLSLVLFNLYKAAIFCSLRVNIYELIRDYNFTSAYVLNLTELSGIEISLNNYEILEAYNGFIL